MARIAAVLAACLTAVTGTLTLQGAAQATYSSPRTASSCTSEFVCLYVTWRRDSDNVGFILETVKVQDDGAPSRVISVDGGELKCMDQNGKVWWSKSGAQTDLGEAPSSKSWSPGLEMYSATELKCTWPELTIYTSGSSSSTRVVDRT